MFINLFSKKGEFYKAALHVHTTISDGKVDVAEMKQAYIDRGYSIVAFSDHEVFVPHNDLTTEDFLAINACEIAVNDESKSAGGWPYLPTYHLNILAKTPDIDYTSVCTENSIYVEHSRQYMTERMKQNKVAKEYTVECINQLIKMASEDGFLVMYNHPYGCLHNYSDYIGLKGLWGVECYNTGSNRGGIFETMQPVDDLLRSGEHVFPVASDDSHTIDMCDGGFVMIKAQNLEYVSVMKALENGDFYASTGPSIYEMYLDDGILHIECSDVEKIFVTTERRVNFCKTSEQDMTPVRAAEFDLNNYIEKSHLTEETYQKAYFRITLVDKHGDEAHSRAYFLAEILEGK